MPTLIQESVQARILRYYERVGPLLEKHFAGVPIAFTNFPHGFDQAPHYHVTGVPLTEKKLLWLCHRYFAVEFGSWVPLPDDRDRLRFGRILLEHAPDRESLNRAALTLTDLLREKKLQAIPLLNPHGVGLWIPFADAPHAAVLRAWLERFCADAVARFPRLFTNEPNTHPTPRVHLHCASNAAGRFSALPYSLRGQETLPVCTPVRWAELQSFAAPLTADEIGERLEQAGDVFGEQLAEIGSQRFADLAPVTMAPVPEPFGQAILAAIEILADGKRRTAGEILNEALARKLVHPGMKEKYVQTSLLQYITRTLGYGRKPRLVRDLDLRFRLNEPNDDWPDLEPFVPPPAADAATHALIDRLEQTATGDDPGAFEIAVCDAFAHMGFLATHLGARSQPDGFADAPLGALGYRVMLECKSVVRLKGTVHDPDCVEASKFKDEYRGDYCTLIAPGFPEDQQLTSELQTHGVTALTVADLQTLLALGANALEVRELLKPGYAADFIGDLTWARRHGLRKRIATAAQIIHDEGWKMQVTSARENVVDPPRLTVDAAMMLVNAELERYNSSEACTREEVIAAFTHLTDPLVGAAAWSDAGRGDVVILSPA